MAENKLDLQNKINVVEKLHTSVKEETLVFAAALPLTLGHS